MAQSSIGISIVARLDAPLPLGEDAIRATLEPLVNRLRDAMSLTFATIDGDPVACGLSIRMAGSATDEAVCGVAAMAAMAAPVELSRAEAGEHQGRIRMGVVDFKEGA